MQEAKKLPATGEDGDEPNPYATGMVLTEAPAQGVVAVEVRHAKTPDVLPGMVTTHGNLDKEIIRRIVRRHLNEVKYCYDQALVRKPKLDGRLVAQFTIAGNGQVIASVKQSSTLGDPTAEMCVVNAIKRWEFPSPTGGGLAIVTYPFTFNPAGN